MADIEFVDQLGIAFLGWFPEFEEHDPDTEGEVVSNFISNLCEFVEGPEKFDSIEKWVKQMRDKFEELMEDPTIRPRFIDGKFIKG